MFAVMSVAARFTRHLLLLACTLTTAVGCGTAKPGGMSGPTINNRVGPAPTEARSPVVSWDILDREPLANEVAVRHILIGWAELADNYGGRQDPRAAKRSKRDAERDTLALVEQIRNGGDFIELMNQHSEDRGSAESSRPLTVTPDAQFVIEFKQLSLRLAPGQSGVCQSAFGFHIIRRDP